MSRAASPGRETREKDLERHFKAEPVVSSPEQPSAPHTLPANLKPWDVAEKLKDPPLKVSLEYINSLAGTEQATPPRAGASDR